MSRRLPLTEPEGERLELKSKDVLREPEKVAREAVAMLNSQGGEIWIGIREAGDRREVEPIADAEGERRRLQDHLVDVIEPRLTSKEIAVAIEGKNEGGPVLLVTVEPRGGRGPYAFLRPQGARYFLRRFGDRIVPMSREEILAGSRTVQGEQSRVAADILREDLGRLLTEKGSKLWMRSEPAIPGELDFSKVIESGLLIDPTRSGMQRWSYNVTAAAYHGVAHLEGGALVEGGDELSLRLFRTGGIEFAVALASFAVNVPFVDARQLLSPEALLGYLLSVFRLASRLLGDPSLWHVRPEGGLWTMLAILGLKDWIILPGERVQWASWRREIERFRFPAQDFFMEQPILFSREDVTERPDESGMRIVRRLYEAFGIFRDGDLPSIRSAGLL